MTDDLISRADAIALAENAHTAVTTTDEIATSAIEGVIRSIRALPAYEVAVKPLEWDRHPDAEHDPWRNEHYGGGQNNLAGQNEYAVYPHPCAVGYFVLDVMGNRCDEDFPSIAAAKAAAQADYAARIRSALTATPVQDCREHSGDTDCSVTAYAALARMKEAGE